MEAEIATMRELLGGFPRPPPVGASSSVAAAYYDGLQGAGVKRILKTLALGSKMIQVSKEDVSQYSFLSGFEDEDSSDGSNEASS
ncbi:hypothetical protein HAX54_003821 [Datura stramonium]|uniref:Uncharacterized protein n=1 Tax=Datura stramonium TaxID=4076 RepID=A0ABS8T5Y8_DATST|nr:hypothetical protein [Datura stramonium]